MFEWTRGVSGWIAIVHKSYGRWDWFVQLQRADAWVRHCRETGNEKFISLRGGHKMSGEEGNIPRIGCESVIVTREEWGTTTKPCGSCPGCREFNKLVAKRAREREAAKR